MKFTAVFGVVAFFFVGTAIAANFAAPIAPREASPEPVAIGDALLGRSTDSCTPSSCICNRHQGQFCGNEKINRNCRNGYVYECNKDTGKTCVYGIRDSCVRCSKLQC
ncbi:hypothetical protein AX14_003193 [Amanita brunnescens Koide BX004]|nr:hypothetical protein AX14_003193 [Amanita brunnescens Koide BX004]